MSNPGDFLLSHPDASGYPRSTIGSSAGALSDLPKAAGVTGMHTLRAGHIVSAFDANSARMAQRIPHRPTPSLPRPRSRTLHDLRLYAPRRR